MTPTQVYAARLDLGLTQSGLAAMLRLANPNETGKRTIREWEKGTRAISGPASVALEALLTGWRPNNGDNNER
jgi:DNA-binding transcriptional regulator YiaG